MRISTRTRWRACMVVVLCCIQVDGRPFSHSFVYPPAVFPSSALSLAALIPRSLFSRSLATPRLRIRLPRALAAYVAPYSREKRLLSAALVTDALLTVCVPLIGKKLYEASEHGSQVPESLAVMVLFSGLFLAADGLDPLRRWLLYRSNALQTEMIEQIRHAMARAWLRVADPIRPAKGMASRLYLEAPALARLALDIPIRAVASVVHVLWSGFWLIQLDLPMAAATTFSAVLLMVWERSRAQAGSALEEHLHAHDQRLMNDFQAWFLPERLRDIRANRLEKHFIAEWSSQLARRTQEVLAHERFVQITNAVTDKLMSFVLITVVTLWNLWRQFYWDVPSTGHLVAVIALSWHVYYRLGTLFELRRRAALAWHAARPLLRLLGRSKPEKPAAHRVEGAPLLSVFHLSYALAGQALFSAVGLTLQKGDAFLIKGPSGSGKTTLLRLITGLLQPDSGSVRINGRFVFLGQEPLSPSEGTVRDYLRRRRLPDVPHHASAMFSALGFRDPGALEAQPIGNLSGGERQRVALAAALLSQPDLLILDEPFSALDPDNRRRAEHALADWTAQGGALLIATHRPVRLPNTRRLRLGV